MSAYNVCFRVEIRKYQHFLTEKGTLSRDMLKISFHLMHLKYCNTLIHYNLFITQSVITQFWI